MVVVDARSPAAEVVRPAYCAPSPLRIEHGVILFIGHAVPMLTRYRRVLALLREVHVPGRHPRARDPCRRRIYTGLDVRPFSYARRLCACTHRNSTWPDTTQTPRKMDAFASRDITRAFGGISSQSYSLFCCGLHCNACRVPLRLPDVNSRSTPFRPSGTEQIWPNGNHAPTIMVPPSSSRPGSAGCRSRNRTPAG